MKKIFLLCLMIMLAVASVASAKEKGLPENERIIIAVEVTDSSRYNELGTANLLKLFLDDKLREKNLLTIVGMKNPDEAKNSDGLIRDEDVTADTKTAAENIGEILVFDAIELRTHSDTPENFDRTFYENLGAAYVVRCEVLGIGATKIINKTIGLISDVVGGGLALAGSGNSDRDKTLRRVGAGIDWIGFGSTLASKRTALNTVVSMQFISVETGKILWQENYVGQAAKHHSARKGYANPWEQAYNESVEDSAKHIAKRVNKYIDSVVIKGKSDKNFHSKKSLNFGSFIK